MSRVRRNPDKLFVRGDWAFVKFAYFPAIVIGIVLAIIFPPFAVARVSVWFNPWYACSICTFLERWGHHVEEFWNRKPLLTATKHGLVHENGGEAVTIPWEDFGGVYFERRDAHRGEIKPAIWMMVHKRDFDPIEVWPRSVDGGLFAMRRWARQVSRCAPSKA